MHFLEVPHVLPGIQIERHDRGRKQGFLGGIRGQLAGLTRLLLEKAAKLTTGGFKGALLLLRVAVIQQRPFLLENIEDESFNWRFSQRRGFIQVAEDFTAQYPEIVAVLA